MLNIHKFSGFPKQCGAAYAKKFQREIAGFFSQEFGAYKYSKQYVRSCLKVMKEEAPYATAFIQGASEYSLLSVEEHTLLTLHEEELYHRKLRSKKPHCSAIRVAIKAKRFRGAIVGQNWDWNTSYYPWSSFNRIAIKSLPKFVALSYPGLPACAGLNSSGLSLMWTGAGYYPPLNPKVGVPTYALVFETLLKRDVVSAVSYLKKVQNAGAFIFFLGDCHGKFAIVEAVPGKIFVEFGDFGHRANVFECPKAVAASRQKLPGIAKCHSLKRNKVFARTSSTLRTRKNLEGVKAMLSQPTILIEKSYSHASLMQLIADSRHNELHVRSWMQKQNPWIRIAV